MREGMELVHPVSTQSAIRSAGVASLFEATDVPLSGRAVNFEVRAATITVAKVATYISRRGNRKVGKVGRIPYK